MRRRSVSLSLTRSGFASAMSLCSSFRRAARSTVRRSGARFTQMVQNTYRVLLTRGMKGCYVTFMDKNTEHFIP
jgi:DUF2075 family protein